MAERKTIQPPGGVIPSSGIQSQYQQNGMPPAKDVTSTYSPEQEELLAFKKALTENFYKEIDEPTFRDSAGAVVPDAGFGWFGQASGYALVKKKLGFNVKNLPQNFRDGLPPESAVTIHTSRYQSDKVVLYVEYKPEDGTPTKWYAVMKKAADPGHLAKQASVGVDLATVPAKKKQPVAKMMMETLGGIFAQYGAALPPPDATPKVIHDFYSKIKNTDDKKLRDMALGLATFAFGGPKHGPRDIYEKGVMIYEGLKAETQRGLTYPDDAAMAKTVQDRINASFGDNEEHRAKGRTNLSDPAFLTEFARIAGPASNDTSATLLGRNKNGESLKERVKLITDATDSLDVAVWKIYGDKSGETFVKALLDKRKANPNMPITVVVDGNVANRAAQYLKSTDPKKAESKRSAELLQELEKAGIEVVRWVDPNNPLNGMHFKGIVADANTDQPKCIVGGRNVGDWYMGDGHWRDCDVLWNGKVARAVHQQIAEMTNYSLNLTNPLRTKAGAKAQTLIPVLSAAEMEKPVTVQNPDAKAFSIVDVPGPNNAQDVAAAMVKAFDAAETSIDIEQGYFLQVPAVTEAIKNAIHRGVKVRILTNGEESNDVEILNLFTKVALNELLALGKTNLEVYTKRSGKNADGMPTNTLHAKAFVVDNKFCGVGSWNQHPRSMILEAEGMNMAMDEALSRQMTEDFEADIQEAHKEDIATMEVTQQEKDFAKRLHFIMGSQT